MEELLTAKQIALKDYLLQRLGFKKDEFLDAHVEQLHKIARNHILLAAVENKDYSEETHEYYFQHDIWNVWLPERFGIIDLLMWEYKMKKNISFKDIFKGSKYISATDLANFIFCGVGYSISKSFEGTRNLLAERGTEYHEQKRLLIEDRLLFEDRNIRAETEGKEPIYVNHKNRYFFDDIASSRIIYSGHSEEEDKKYFTNEEKEFIGQPDYIFKNSRGQHYVVEEKFKVLRDSQHNYFADSHKIQLASYIHYLKEYNIQYGYLVYWIYKYEDGDYRGLEECHVLRVNREGKIEDYLDNLVLKLKEINQRTFLNIDVNKLSPRKCASCAHVVICSHKNRRNNQVNIPYSKSYFRLYYAPYRGCKTNCVKGLSVLPLTQLTWKRKTSWIWKRSSASSWRSSGAANPPSAKTAPLAPC